MASIRFGHGKVIVQSIFLQFPPRSEIRLYLSPCLRYELVTGVVEILRAWAIKWAQLHFCGLNGSEDILPQSWNTFFTRSAFVLILSIAPIFSLRFSTNHEVKKISGHYLRYFWYIWREKHVCHDNIRELLIPRLKALCTYSTKSTWTHKQSGAYQT